MRTKMDVLRDLAQTEREIASNRRTAQNTPNPTTATICDRVLPSLMRRKVELVTELSSVPEISPRELVPVSTPKIHFPDNPAALDIGEIPEFLRRTK